MQQEAFHHHVSLLASILRRIARLATLSNSDPDLVVNRKRSRQLFLEVFSGDFGKKLVQVYADMLQSGLPDNWDNAVGSDEETSRSAFVIILLCMTDVWRRSPATSKSTVACAQACPRCVDTCFSQKILEARCTQRNSKTAEFLQISQFCRTPAV